MRVLGLLAMVSLLVTACGVSTPSGSPTPIALACEVRIDRGVLPDWARTGFTESSPSAPHVVGRSGALVAILFGDPLTTPPRPDLSNKILWVARQAVAAGDLHITAQRMDGTVPVGDPVDRVVAGGPGPSTIDLPDAGCWRFTLSWADRMDSLDLAYIHRAG